LFEVSLDPLITINSNGKITDANSATENIVGVSRDSLLGSDFSSYFTEPYKAQIGYQKIFEQVLSSVIRSLSDSPPINL